jgi:NADPH-dependent curcumin reductase CurA
VTRRKNQEGVKLSLSSPALVLSIIIASAYGALFHVWKGKAAKDLLVYLAAGLVGFGLGQLAGDTLRLGIFMIGQVHIIEASLICWLILLIAKWLKM